jgi:hypothetical protein
MSGQIQMGTNSIDSEGFDGITLASFVDRLDSTFHIRGCSVLVNGSPTSDMNYIIRSDDNIQFIRQAGSKGA